MMVSIAIGYGYVYWMGNHGKSIFQLKYWIDLNCFWLCDDFTGLYNNQMGEFNYHFSGFTDDKPLEWKT